MHAMLVAATFASASASVCPQYSDISQPSVSAESGFAMKKLEGVWNILATSEPTIPSPCRQCGVINFTVYGADYRYHTTTNCPTLTGGRMNVTMELGGHIGGLGEEGNCAETFVAFNGTVGALMPNMFFNHTEDWYMSYACGTQFGLLKVRSFFLAARNGLGKNKEWIEEKLEWAKANGWLEGWEDIAITDSDTLEKCWAASMVDTKNTTAAVV